MFTTVTYLTTLFDGQNSKVQSRVHVLSSSITPGLQENETELILRDDKHERALDFSKNDIEELSEDSFPQIAPSNEEEEHHDDSLYTTFTYYTTIFGGNDKKVLTRSEVIKNNINPTAVYKVSSFNVK